jgi:hypothetical protein
MRNRQRITQTFVCPRCKYRLAITVDRSSPEIGHAYCTCASCGSDLVPKKLLQKQRVPRVYARNQRKLRNDQVSTDPLNNMATRPRVRRVKLQVKPMSILPQLPKLSEAVEKYEAKRASCCNILYVHHELLKDDPNRLTTEFIKKITQCKCD